MLRSYMQDNITGIYSNGEDIHGEPLATTNVDMKAYVDWESHLVGKISGEQVISSPMISRATVYVMPERNFTHKDKIEISLIKYTILDIKTGKDFSSNHQEIHLA